MGTPRLSQALRFTDHLLAGKLAEFIAERRALPDRMSWQQIARALREATDGVVDVTDVTVSKWGRTLGVADDEPERAVS